MDVVNKGKLLEVTDLKVSFQQGKETTLAVDGISFEIFPSETLAIVGESGSGKSVTALSVMKLIPDPPGKVEAGKMRFLTKDNRLLDLQSVSEPEMTEIRGKNIAMVFQEPMTALNPLFSIGEQIAEVLQLKMGLSARDAVQKAVALIADTGIAEPERRAREA